MGNVLEDFNKLHITVRSFVIAVILLTPFWYFDLFLFKRDFVSHDYIQVMPIVVAFCLSLVWIAANAISCLFFMLFLSEGKLDEKDDIIAYSVITVIISVLHLGGYTYFAHLWQWTFYKFLNWTYLFVIIRLFIWLILAFLNSRQKSK